MDGFNRFQFPYMADGRIWYLVLPVILLFDNRIRLQSVPHTDKYFHLYYKIVPHGRNNDRRYKAIEFLLLEMPLVRSYTNVTISLPYYEPVSYTHLDVYKRQLDCNRKVGQQ